MSPEIRINDQLIYDGPDETGWGKTVSGGDIYVNVDQINPVARVQNLLLRSEALAGKIGRNTQDGTRIVQLSSSGRGCQELPNGYSLEVKLKDVPLRRSRKENTWTSGIWNVWERRYTVKPSHWTVHELIWTNPNWPKNRKRR